MSFNRYFTPLDEDGNIVVGSDVTSVNVYSTGGTSNLITSDYSVSGGVLVIEFPDNTDEEVDIWVNGYKVIENVSVSDAGIFSLDNAVVHLADAETMTGQKTFSAGLKTDAIDEETDDTGVTVDGVLLKDGDVEATDITASGTIYGTLDKVNLATGGSLPTTGWSAASGTDWNWYYDYTVTGLTTSDFVIVSIDKDGLDDAQYSEVAPSVDSVSGGIRFYCNTVPTTAISFDYTVIKG